MILNRFEKKYDRGELRGYERIVAGEDISGSFIHTSFIEEGNLITAIYEYDGYLRVNECRFKNEIQLLNLLQKVLLKVKHAGEYYIDPDRLDISDGTVFYRPSDEDVRIAYVLSYGVDFRTSLLRFCRNLIDGFENGTVFAMEEIVKYITDNPCGIDDIIKEIDTLKKRI